MVYKVGIFVIPHVVISHCRKKMDLAVTTQYTCFNLSVSWTQHEEAKHKVTPWYFGLGCLLLKEGVL